MYPSTRSFTFYAALSIMLAIFACTASKSGQNSINSAQNTILVKPTQPRLINIVVRDLVTIKSKPTGLQLVDEQANKHGFFILKYDQSQFTYKQIKKAIEAHPNVVGVFE